VAERVTAEIVNLPTDMAPHARGADQIEELLEAFADRIL
jgi:hypothetical protein